MAIQMYLKCVNCHEGIYCNPVPIPIEAMGELVAKNPRVADAIYDLEKTVLVCPVTKDALIAKLT